MMATLRKYLSHMAVSLLVLGIVALSPGPALAQDNGQEDPPGRVARLNFVQGSVSYQVSGDQDWVQADPNRPLTTGDNLWADADSRGEVHIGSTALRMASQTGISFLTLDDRTVQLQLAQGLIEVHVRRLSPGDAFEIDTPNLAFTLARGGEYRIATDPDGGSTTITVREGEGEVTGAGQTWELLAGQMYTFNGSDDISYDSAAAPGYDDFENWCQSRDQWENASQSAKYVSRDVDGYYDLDEYGDWRTDPDYGAVWVPRGVAAGWAPYQVGHWVYVAPWGWTWVDAEPWGFAPFHYGRWAFVGGYWGWVPGPVVVRPVYAPALVGFVGGGGFGVSVAFGGGIAGVGWFPLGPRDVFVPAYHTSPRYFQNINVTNTRIVNVTQVTNVYNTVYIRHDRGAIDNDTYARNQTAVTAVSRDTFVNARPVAGAQVRVSAEQIQGARVVETAPMAPTRSSYLSSTAKVATNRPAVPFAQRPVVARLNPAVSRPVNQPAPNRPGFQSFGNNNRDTNNRDAARGGNPAGGSVNNNGQQASRDGFRPFTSPAGSTNGSVNNNATRNPTTNTANNNQADRSTTHTDQTTQGDQRQPMRFAPPAKARDEDYDVHPPLNQPQAREQPKPEQKQEQKQEKENKKEDDKKDKK
jgi:hypothetical protein